MNEKKFENIQLSQLNEVADFIISLFRQHKTFAFFATMGAGKTTLMSVVCEKMNILETANSPTFTIVNEYNLPNKNKIIHIDAYRLKNLNEAIEIGLEEILENENNIVFIEWAEIVAGLLPANSVKISILVNRDLTRNFLIQYP